MRRRRLRAVGASGVFNPGRLRPVINFRGHVFCPGRQIFAPTSRVAAEIFMAVTTRAQRAEKLLRLGAQLSWLARLISHPQRQCTLRPDRNWLAGAPDPDFYRHTSQLATLPGLYSRTPVYRMRTAVPYTQAAGGP